MSKEKCSEDVCVKTCAAIGNIVQESEDIHSVLWGIATSIVGICAMTPDPRASIKLFNEVLLSYEESSLIDRAAERFEEFMKNQQ